MDQNERSRKDTMEAAARHVRTATRASRAHATLAGAQHRLGDTATARQTLDVALAMPPGRAEDHEALGFVAFSLGAHEAAERFYRRVVEALPDDAEAWYNLATALRNVGALEAAEAACDRCLALDAEMAAAALLRAHVRVQSHAHNHVEALRDALRRPRAAPGSDIMLHYALGKELDDLGAYDDAFAHFAAGARLRRASLQYEVADDVRKLARIREVFSADTVAKAAPPTSPIRDGFIIGLPRSGTTLIERVLGGHPAVSSNGETDNLLAALMDGTPRDGGDIFERVAAASPDAVQASYHGRARGAGGAALVLEKLPLNYLYAGAIRRTLPEARLLSLRRNPMDNCLAMFSTLFRAGYPFSYALEDLAAYYIAYDQLTRHWSATVPDIWLEVAYEDFVQDPLGQGRRIAAHVGLDWRDEMARVERNTAPTATASAAQVRRPIYRSAVARWRAYERHLAPLADRLVAAGIDVG